MDKKLTGASKFMSLLLRHKPETIGLELDECGWANIDELIELTRQHKNKLNLELIKYVIESNDKQRFSISEDGCFVRANQGHSIEVDLNLKPQLPPQRLFHGTAIRFKAGIFEKGLGKMNRQHVHLSAAKETAISVGSRHGKPMVLLVESELMHEDGYEFYLSRNGVWLTESVPTRYLSESEA